MGLNIKDLIVKKEIAIRDLRGKVLAVDTHNLLYQFLTTIRGPDGSPLTNSKGNITSHLIGFFSRTTSLMEQGLKLVFVFDGKPPEIKRQTQEKRKEIKIQASLKLQEAEEAGNIADMKKFAARTARLTQEMTNDTKDIIRAFGLPIVQAPSEGEAQAAFMVQQGDAYASVSQDYDNLIFGCPRMVKNLSIAGKRRKTGTLAYITVKPEMILLDEVLEELELTREQLVVLAILVGTDYNPKGIKGIGQKKGLKLVKESADFPTLFEQVGWDEQYPDLSWKEVYDTIVNMPVTNEYTLEWNNVDEEKVRSLLIEYHEFGADRVNNKLEALREARKQGLQKGLSSFF